MSQSLLKFCRDEPNDNITDSVSFKLKSKFTNDTSHAWTSDVEKVAPLNYLDNFWRTLEIPLINSKVTVILD